MSTFTPLHEYLVRSAARTPEQVAIVDPGVAEISYAELDRLSDRLRDRLRALGVLPGDRVGVYLRKSIDSVATIFGSLKSGAAHVPVDPTGPPPRNALILADCTVRVVVTERRFVDGLKEAWAAIGFDPAWIVLDEPWGGPPPHRPLGTALDHLDAESPTPGPAGANARPGQDELAYILYTSGSTGKPKGVMISHENASCFIDWCSREFAPRADDRFTSHAPFHFDLSVLDIYVPLKHGATLVLISEQAGKDPVTLAQLTAEQRITCWYSTPSILALLVQFGHLERFDYSALRIVHFAGEVFPIKHLRAIKEIWPRPRYFNLYGPTETNVCTWYEVPRVVEPERTEPYPIGRPCAPYVRAQVLDPDFNEVTRGEEGELWIGGPGVMRGYWNATEMSAAVFRTDAAGEIWYRTGDVVVEEQSGDFIYHGRRDRMVKKRGFRIELGEIEAALYRLPDIKEAAVIAKPDPESGVRIRAFLAFKSEKLSIIKLKQFSGQNLQSYMVPDDFIVLESLPKTSTDKTDYQTMKEMP